MKRVRILVKFPGNSDSLILENVPLDIKISNLQKMIINQAHSNSDPSKVRLIYQGKLLKLIDTLQHYISDPSRHIIIFATGIKSSRPNSHDNEDQNNTHQNTENQQNAPNVNIHFQFQPNQNQNPNGQQQPMNQMGQFLNLLQNLHQTLQQGQQQRTNAQHVKELAFYRRLTFICFIIIVLLINLIQQYRFALDSVYKQQKILDFELKSLNTKYQNAKDLLNESNIQFDEQENNTLTHNSQNTIQKKPKPHLLLRILLFIPFLFFVLYPLFSSPRFRHLHSQYIALFLATLHPNFKFKSFINLRNNTNHA